MKSTINIEKRDISKCKSDAIVNAANARLEEGGGVCGAIFKAAGSRELTKACQKIGSCPTGSAVITPGFQLHAKYIIHAVGPKWHGGDQGEENLLKACYQKALELAKEHDLHSIVFPLISSGIYGYPKDQAWLTALFTVRDFLRNNEDYELHITFVVHDDQTMGMGALYLNWMASDEDLDFPTPSLQ